MILWDNTAVYNHLENRSVTELYELKHRNEARLQTLRRKEPGEAYKDSALYYMWVGRNVEYISRLEKLRGELTRRTGTACDASQKKKNHHPEGWRAEKSSCFPF